MIMDASTSGEERDTRPNLVPDESEFTVFYRSTIAPLVHFLMLMGLDLPSAQDVAQDAMIRLFSHWSQVEHPRAWIWRVASRQAIRRQVANREMPVDVVPDTPVDDPAAARSDLLELQRILAELPERQREVLALTLADFTAREIATMLGIGVDTTRQYLSIARNKLKEQLRTKGQGE